MPLRSMRRALGVLMLAGLAALPGTTRAQQADAAMTPEAFRAALLAGESRLTHFALRQAGAGPSVALLRAVAFRDGFLHQAGAGPTLVRRGQGLSPYVVHEPNINNGIGAETFTLGPFRFRVNEDNIAKSGLMAGVRGYLGAGWSIGQGRVLTLSGRAQAQRSFDYHITHTDVSAGACLEQFLGAWTWLDGCVGARRAVEVSSAEDRHASLALSHAFMLGGSPTLGRLDVRRTERMGSYVKVLATVSTVTGVPHLGALRLSLSAGEEVDGFTTLLRGASVAVTRPVFGLRSTLSLSMTEEGGGAFFGQPRKDTVATVRLKTRPVDFLSVTVGAERRDSTVETFDDTRLLLDFDVLSLSGLRDWAGSGFGG